MASTLTASALTTLVAVKAELPQLGSDTSQDVYLEGLINAYSAAIESYCRRRLKSRKYLPSGADESAGEVNLKLNGNDRITHTVMLLPEFPVIAITAVTIKDIQLRNIVTLTDLANQLAWEPDSGKMILLTGHLWERGLQNIEIAFEAGYKTVPFDLQRACIMQVVWGFYQKDRSRQGMESISFQSETVTYFTGAMLPEVKLLLDKYRMPLVSGIEWPESYQFA